MLQWFIWFPEFTEFSENFSHLEKTPVVLDLPTQNQRLLLYFTIFEVSLYPFETRSTF